MPLIGESDEGQVDGVQHQLNRHEDGDDVALDEKAAMPMREEDSAQHQIVGNGDSHAQLLLPCQRNRAENCNQNQYRRDLEGQQQIAE